MKYLAPFGFLLLYFNTYSQVRSVDRIVKPPITASTLGSWSSIGAPSISDDGEYVYYTTRLKGSSSLIIQNLTGSWKFQIEGASNPSFGNSDGRLYFIKSRDSLCYVQLGVGVVNFIDSCISFSIVPGKTVTSIVYRPKAFTGNLIVRNVKTGDCKKFLNVVNYYIDPLGKDIFVETTLEGGGALNHELNYINLNHWTKKVIWTGSAIGNLVFNRVGEQIAFLVNGHGDRASSSIWFFKCTDNVAIELTKGVFYVDSIFYKVDRIAISGFSSSDSSLFVMIKRGNVDRPSISSVVDIWRYNDVILPTRRDFQSRSNNDRSYLAAINLYRHDIVKIERDGDVILQPIGQYNRYFLILNRSGDPENEWHWNSSARSSIYLTSAATGVRILLSDHLPDSRYESVAYSYRLSPLEKYVIYYDVATNNYYSYEIVTGKVNNITKGINARWTTYVNRDIPMARYMPIGSPGSAWLKGDSSVLIYEQNDVYLADLTGRRHPTNLTNGYGRKNNIVFRISMDNYKKPYLGNRIIFNAFNRVNKDNGFFLKDISYSGNPILLSMQPYLLEGTDESSEFSPVVPPMKANDASVYIVRRMSAFEFPNYFYTKDFTSFYPITDIHPERTVNWLKTELITWKDSDGNTLQGILYKPENFDSSKKYPILFYYYEKLSNGLNGFIMPQICRGPLNIPFYVSDGYLVFTPDISFKMGYPGRSALNSVVSAATYMSKKPWVDARRMGIQGHSRGGFETNYIITHTGIFAAAMSSSGISDLVSLYGGLRESGVSRQSGEELYYQRIGASLWRAPQLYIENSPVFKANKVTTPVLMMANKLDGDIPFTQGVEFFMALRRLQKRVWMLQYEGQGHLVFDNAANDLNRRMKEFFDHYLKGAKAPKWMTEEVKR